MPDTFLIITSIAPSTNRVLQTFASECQQNNMHFIVIGDSKSPAGFSLKNCDFYSLDQQKGLPFKMAGSLPECKYSRKNLGYLLAMKHDAKVIIETDDDNFPTIEFWKGCNSNHTSIFLLIRDGQIFTVTIRRRTSGRVDLRSNIFKMSLFGSMIKPKVSIALYSKVCAMKIRMLTVFTDLHCHYQSHLEEREILRWAMAPGVLLTRKIRRGLKKHSHSCICLPGVISV